MANPLELRAYYAVTTATFTIPQSLMALVQAAYLALTGAAVIPDLAAAEVQIQALGSVNVLIGDAQLSTTNYGYELLAGDYRRYGPYSIKSAIPLSNIYVMSDDGIASGQLAVEIIPA